MVVRKYLLYKYTQYYNPLFADHVSHLTKDNLVIDEFSSNLMTSVLNEWNGGDVLPFHDTTVTIQQVVNFWQLWYYLGITFYDDEHINLILDDDPLIAKFQALSTDDDWYKLLAINAQQQLEMESNIENINVLINQISVLERMPSNASFTSLIEIRNTLNNALAQLKNDNADLLDIDDGNDDGNDEEEDNSDDDNEC